jgi:hypothetical protein
MSPGVTLMSSYDVLAYPDDHFSSELFRVLIPNFGNYLPRVKRFSIGKATSLGEVFGLVRFGGVEFFETHWNSML